MSLAKVTPKHPLFKKKDAEKKKQKSLIISTHDACKLMVSLKAASANLTENPSGSRDGAKTASDMIALRRQMSRAIFGPSLGPGETVKVRLPTVDFPMQSSVGSIIQTIYGIQLTSVAGYADWQTVFGQYRFLEMELNYTPYFRGASTNTGLVIGGIDYGTSTAVVASLSAATQLDSSKAVRLSDKASWKIDLSRGLGALDWIDTATSTVYACFKCCSDNNSGVGVSQYYGTFTGHALIEFKGLQ
jgi:hypothetical protein